MGQYGLSDARQALDEKGRYWALGTSSPFSPEATGWRGQNWQQVHFGFAD
jgi:hypothetical protein